MQNLFRHKPSETSLQNGSRGLPGTSGKLPGHSSGPPGQHFGRSRGLVGLPRALLGGPRELPGGLREALFRRIFLFRHVLVSGGVPDPIFIDFRLFFVDFGTILGGFRQRNGHDFGVFFWGRPTEPGCCQNSPFVSGTPPAGFLGGTAISRSGLNYYTIVFCTLNRGPTYYTVAFCTLNRWPTLFHPPTRQKLLRSLLNAFCINFSLFCPGPKLLQLLNIREGV